MLRSYPSQIYRFLWLLRARSLGVEVMNRLLSGELVPSDHKHQFVHSAQTVTTTSNHPKHTLDLFASAPQQRRSNCHRCGISLPTILTKELVTVVLDVGGSLEGRKEGSFFIFATLVTSTAARTSINRLRWTISTRCNKSLNTGEVGKDIRAEDVRKQKEGHNNILLISVASTTTTAKQSEA
ncbi:hypothetical protein SDJN03_19865, partial [Cucurbita argyrosperma subsp. sororia]